MNTLKPDHIKIVHYSLLTISPQIINKNIHLINNIFYNKNPNLKIEIQIHFYMSLMAKVEFQYFFLSLDSKL